MSSLQPTIKSPKIISILRLLFILSISSYQMLLRYSVSSSFCTPSPSPPPSSSSLSFLVVTQPKNRCLFSRIVFQQGEASQSPTTMAMTTQSSRLGDTSALITQRTKNNLNRRYRNSHNTHHSSSSNSNNVADVVDNSDDDDTEAEEVRRRKETDLKRLQFELAQYRSDLEEKELDFEKVQAKVERLEKEEVAKLVSLEDDKVEERISVFREERDIKQKRLNSLLLQQRKIETILLQNRTDLETQRSQTTETLQTKITNLTTEIERAQLQLDSITTNTNNNTVTSNETTSPLSPRLTAIAPDITIDLINNLQSIRNTTSERLLSIQEDLIYIRRYYARKCSDLRASLTTAQSDYASIRSQTDLLRADVERLEGMLLTVPAEFRVKETEIRRKIEELKENDQRRDRKHRESMALMVRGFARRVRGVEDRGEADTDGLERALAAELTGLQLTLEKQNDLVWKGMNEEMEVCRENAAEELEEARRKWRGEMRNVTRTGVERIRALREEASEVTARLEADIEADIRKVWEKNERVLKNIQREKEEALEALEFKKKAELKQYKMYEVDVQKKLINLNAKREELETLVVEREELLAIYDEDKKSFRKLLRLIMKIARKRTEKARKRVVKRILR